MFGADSKKKLAFLYTMILRMIKSYLFLLASPLDDKRGGILRQVLIRAHAYQVQVRIGLLIVGRSGNLVQSYTTKDLTIGWVVGKSLLQLISKFNQNTMPGVYPINSRNLQV